MSLQVELEQHRNTLIVRLRGELDHHTADIVRFKIEDALLRGRCHHVVLNLQELSFMDSSGLGVVLGRYKSVSSRGGKLVVCGAQPAVKRLFELSGLLKILPFHDTERAALAGLEVVS